MNWGGKTEGVTLETLSTAGDEFGQQSTHLHLLLSMTSETTQNNNNNNKNNKAFRRISCFASVSTRTKVAQTSCC